MFSLRCLVSEPFPNNRKQEQVEEHEITGVWHFHQHLLISKRKRFDRTALVYFDLRSDSSETSGNEIDCFDCPIITVCYDSTNLKRVFVVLKNGVVAVYHFLRTTSTTEWKLFCRLNLHTTLAGYQPEFFDNSAETFWVTSASLNVSKLEVYWCEKQVNGEGCETSAGAHSCHVYVSHISDTRFATRDSNMNLTLQSSILTLERTHKILSWCPPVRLHSFNDTIWASLAPCTNAPSIWFVVVGDSSIRFMDHKGISIETKDRTVNVDFISVFLYRATMFTSRNETYTYVGHCANINQKYMHVIYSNGMVSTFNPSGMLASKVTIFNLTLHLTSFMGCHAQGNLLFIFTTTAVCICSINQGKVLQIIDRQNMNETSTVDGIWFSMVKLPTCGFYTLTHVYQLVLNPVAEVFSQDVFAQNPSMLLNACHPHAVTFAYIKSMLRRKCPTTIPSCLLSSFENRALVLALLQFAKEQIPAYQNSDMLNQDLFTEDDTLEELKTFYNMTQKPLVDCFCTLEIKKQLIKKHISKM